jgi:hypothetical protein
MADNFQIADGCISPTNYACKADLVRGCVVGRGQHSQKSAGNDSDPSKQTFRLRNAWVAPTLERIPTFGVPEKNSLDNSEW